jgi:hypothetical protein
MYDATRFDHAARLLSEFRDEVLSTPPESMDLLEIERHVHEMVNGLGLAVMREVLERADTGSAEVVIHGEQWGNRRVCPGTYTTVFGDVEDLPRSTYQRLGRGRVAVPLELRLGLVEGRYTPRMARIMSRAVALMPEHEAEAFLKELGVAMVSVSTLHRIPRAIAARHEIRREVLEQHVRERDEIPADAVTIQAGVDGVMVPQDGERAAPRGRKTESPEPPRHEQRYGPLSDNAPANHDGKERRAWHEASVGTIAYFDQEGRRLRTTYLGRMPEASKKTLLDTLEKELQGALAEKPGLNVIFASDGAPGHWAAFEAISERLPASVGHTMMLVDLFHVAEYLTPAAEAIWGKETREATLNAQIWRERIKLTADGVDSVIASLEYRRSLMKRGKAPVTKAIQYIRKQHALGRMNYVDAQTRNYPIGTGVTEAAAKTLVTTRMKRAGARFDQHGGQTILLFRSAVLSERFDLLHAELLATYQADVREAA